MSNPTPLMNQWPTWDLLLRLVFMALFSSYFWYLVWDRFYRKSGRSCLLRIILQGHLAGFVLLGFMLLAVASIPGPLPEDFEIHNLSAMLYFPLSALAGAYIAARSASKGVDDPLS